MPTLLLRALIELDPNSGDRDRIRQLEVDSDLD